MLQTNAFFQFASSKMSEMKYILTGGKNASILLKTLILMRILNINSSVGYKEIISDSGISDNIYFFCSAFLKLISEISLAAKGLMKKYIF